MGELEAVGDIVTGGLIGRAVEPGAGEPGADGHTHERNCLNCGTPLAGDFCHACGQHAHVHRTLTAFFHDLLHGVLHFEGKIWRTLPMLAWKPGDLTRRYIDGQRARFVSPIALFLFCVFLMFAVVSLLGDMDDLSGKAKAGLQEELRDDQAKLVKIEAKRAAAAKAGQPTAKLDQRINRVREEIGGDTKALEGIQTGTAIIDTSDDLPGWLGGSLSEAAKNP